MTTIGPTDDEGWPMNWIELTANEAEIWQRMSEADQEVTLALFGSLLRWWAKLHPEDTRDTERPPNGASHPPPSEPIHTPVKPPSEAELVADIEAGRYGPRPLRALQLGEINEGNVRRKIATILNPGASEETPPTNEPSPTAGE